MTTQIASSMLFLATGVLLTALSFPNIRSLTIEPLQKRQYIPRHRLTKGEKKSLDFLGLNGSLLADGLVAIALGIIIFLSPHA